MKTTTAIDFNQPDAAKSVGGDLATSTTTLATRLDGREVIDLPSCEQAVLDRQLIGAAVKQVQDFFAPLKAMAHQLHKALCDRESTILSPLLAIDRTKRNAISEFKDAADLARYKEERARIEKETIAQQARAADAAAALERSGEHAMAAAVIEEAIAAPEPVVVVADPLKAVAGLKFTRRWLWRYAGGPKEIKATPPEVVARTMQLIPREFLTLDEKCVGSYARSMKGSGKIPGIEIYYVDDPVR